MLITNYSFLSLQTISFYIQRAMLEHIPLVLAHTSAFFIYTIAQTSSLILGLSAVLLLKAVDVFPSGSDTPD